MWNQWKNEQSDAVALLITDFIKLTQAYYVSGSVSEFIIF